MGFIHFFWDIDLLFMVAQQLIDIGLDLTFFLEGEIRIPVERCLADAREKLMESVKVRALEDKWRPISFANKSGLRRFADVNMSEIGVTSIDAWVYGNIATSK